MHSSNARLSEIATIGAAALLTVAHSERTISAPRELPRHLAAGNLVPRIDIIFGYTSGHSRTVFSSPVGALARPRALTSREDAVFRQALMNSTKIIATGRLVAK